MREIFLIIHFVGLAMGLGSSMAFLFIGIAAAKMEAQRRKQFSLDALVISRMGHIGLGLLIFSGLYLMTPHWATLSARPLLIIKLIAVAILVVVTAVATVLANKLKRGEALENAGKLQLLGRISLMNALAIVVLAVLVFR